MNSLCAIGRFNELPMVTLWNTLVGFKDIELFGHKPLKEILVYTEQNGYRDKFLQWSGTYHTNSAYASTAANVGFNWGGILLLLVIFAAAAVIALKFVDRDKR